MSAGSNNKETLDATLLEKIDRVIDIIRRK